MRLRFVRAPLHCVPASQNRANWEQLRSSLRRKEIAFRALYGTMIEARARHEEPVWVERAAWEFPDCEALRLVDEERCQIVKIEFEHQSRNFLKHMHKVDECDVLVCWKHNWPECPLEVVELRTVLSNQLSAFSHELLPPIAQTGNEFTPKHGKPKSLKQGGKDR